MSYPTEQDAVNYWVPKVANILSYENETVVFVYHNRLHVMRIIPIGVRFHVSMIVNTALIDLIKEDR